MAVLFHEWRVDPMPELNENMQAATKRVHTIVENETGQVLLLQLFHPEKAVLSCSRRQ